MERWMGEMRMHVLQMSSGHVKAEQAAPLLACHAAPLSHEDAPPGRSSAFTTHGIIFTGQQVSGSTESSHFSQL